MKCTIDLETYSTVNLKKAGLYKYAEHESTDINCLCWAFDDGPVSAWIPAADMAFINALEPGFGAIYAGPEAPKELLMSLERGDEWHAWNAAFERQILNGPAGQRYGFPKLEIKQTRCSMARSRHASMPGRLEDAANVLNTAVKKRTAGVNAMRYLCKPRANGTRPTLGEERERFLQLVPYCADDVRAERCVDAVLPEMSEEEIRVYHLDQTINDRGVLVDLAAVADMEHLINEYKQQLKDRCVARTGSSPSRPAALAAWVRANGYPELENLQADTVRRVVERPEVPDAVKEILKLYSTYNMKAVAKYPALREAVCADGRIRGMIQYYGAGTGRFSSFIVQIHNLFRSVIEDPDTAIEACRLRDLDWIRALYPGVDPMKVFSSCVRGMLIPGDGCEFVFPDYSGIEARWNVWLFDETWALEAYRRGEDMYVVTYARCFGVSTEGVTKKQRQIGKVLVLSMGYGGGVGAFVKMAKNNNVNLEELLNAKISDGIMQAALDSYAFMKEQGRTGDLRKDLWLVCEALKIMWREAHPKIVRGWWQLNDAACQAVANPGKVYSVANGRIKFKVEDRWLVMRLPSGRKIRYFQPRLKGNELHYQGVDTETRQWGDTSTYGGKLCENEDQGGCRDLLVGALFRFDAAGWLPHFHVHDEPVLEVKKGALSDKEVESLMCVVPEWAKGFPLAIEGHRGARYKK